MDNQVENSTIKGKKENKVELVVIFIGICITSLFRFIMKMDFSNVHTTARSIGVLCGLALSAIIFIFGITALIYKISKKDKKKILLIVSIIYLIANMGIISNEVNQRKEKREKEQAKIRLAEEKMGSLINLFVNGNKIIKEDFTFEKYGEAAEALDFTQNFYSDKQAIENEINNLYELDANTILSYETVSDYNRLLEIREKLNQSIEDLNNYYDSMYRFSETYAEKIKTLDKSNNYNKNFAIGFNKSLDTSSEKLEYQRNVIVKQYKYMGNILKFLEEKKGQYTFKNQQLLFFKDDDVDAYNQLIDEYNNSVDAVTELLNENDKKVKDAQEFLNGEKK